MIFSWRWSGRLSWRSAALLFFGAGVVLLGIAVHLAARRRAALERWPIVRARVDSASVATPDHPREDVYAPRLWLSYRYGGRAWSAPAVEEVYSSGYGRAVRAAERAARAESARVMLDPRDPRALTLDPGYNWRYFFGALLLGGLGLFFCAFGAAFAVLWRRQGGSPVASTLQPMSSGGRWGAPFAFVMGVLFIAAGALGAWTLRRERVEWSAVRARVDSADVVRQSAGGGRGDIYAPRLWVTYSVAGRTYRAPLVGGVYRSDRAAVSRRTDAARLAGAASVLVNPADPYDVIEARAASARALWLPALFALLGAGCIALGALLRRDAGGVRRPRRSRRGGGRTPAPAG